MESLLEHGRETEWIEFKHNKYIPENFGESISALSNGACLVDQPTGYLVYGVQDGSLKVVGTSFNPLIKKKGNEDLQQWVMNRLSPKIHFKMDLVSYKGEQLVIIRIPAAMYHPTKFTNQAYVRIGSQNRKLSEFPELERKLWDRFSQKTFEKEIALADLGAQDVVRLLNIQDGIDLLGLQFPKTMQGFMNVLKDNGFITASDGYYHITNLGAITLAKDIREFNGLSRKAVRVVIYDGNSKVNIKHIQEGTKGYAVGFEGLIGYIESQLPTTEVIGKALRSKKDVYPIGAIRELVANAIIHQDFSETGSGVIIEIYDNRMEITNPGKPLIPPDRFIDDMKSRNESLATIMRRMNICEELGSGVDRVIFDAEFNELPPPDWLEKTNSTVAKLYSYKEFGDMSKRDKIRACFQHCVLKYVNREKMNNASLRERFNLSDKKSQQASVIINWTEAKKLIKQDTSESTSKKFATYIPWFA